VIDQNGINITVANSDLELCLSKLGPQSMLLLMVPTLVMVWLGCIKLLALVLRHFDIEGDW